MTDHVTAGLAGLAPTTRINLFVADGSTRHFEPAATVAGRRAAMQWACSLLCVWDGSVAEALRQAFAIRPDVVVVISDGGPAFEPGPRNGDNKHADAILYQDPIAAVTTDSAPVIAIAVQSVLGQPDSAWMQALATRTRGLYVARLAR